MANFYMPLQLAPTALNQPILPNWSFNLFNLNLGTTSNAEVERRSLEYVGSYGRQIGHLAEAMEVVIRQLGLMDKTELRQEERAALKEFLDDVAAVRRIKESMK